MTQLFGEDAFARARREVAPGATWVPGWLTVDEQAWIVRRFAEWADGPVPIRHPRAGEHVMSVRSVSLGRHWRPGGYTRTAVDVNGAEVLPVPDWLVRLGRRALEAVSADPATAVDYTPDAVLANFYDLDAHMGMHQDRDEPSTAPVVSLSIGDACTFRFGNAEGRARPYEDLRLASGDLFVFGGPSRLAFHGVTRIHPGTAPLGIGLAYGRINLTLRSTGLPA